MLARLLSLLPARMTGRIGPRARREVKSWTKNNVTRRTLAYGKFRRHFMWGTEHPIIFSVITGTCSAAISYALAIREWPWGRLGSPTLKADFDLAAFASVPWSVQATLVALVYPIVVSFIALMLQRKAHSTVGLRVYVLDSGVVVSGASSIALLVVMGFQYLASPYATKELLSKYMAPFIVLNGTWLTMNVLLTGFFLSRTMHFIQEEEQRLAFTRVAVDVVLRRELIAAVKQYIYVNAPNTDWQFPKSTSDREPPPEIIMYGVGAGRKEVSRDLKGLAVLNDVHLHLLRIVAFSWRRRANKGKWLDERLPSTLSFPPRVGTQTSGEVVLCSIENGPTLTRVERWLVRAAFVYGNSRRGTMSLSSKRMLEELGTEVLAAAEQQRFDAAEEALKALIRLHKTLLLASAADAGSTVDSAAAIGISPYAWGDNTFNIDWLRPYKDIGRVAVNYLDVDARLFRKLTAIPALIAAEVPARPEKLITDAQLVCTRLSNQLGAWWVRKAEASLIPGGAPFGGSLPAPLNKVYEQAVVSMIGYWGDLRVEVPKGIKGSEEETWQELTARALVYADHIEKTGYMFLKAVSRGDVVGCRWLLDAFLKWWGTRHTELRCDDFDRHFRARDITLTLAKKEWPQVKHFLWDGEHEVTVDFAKRALNFAIRNYWESMRLFLALILIKNAGQVPAENSLELRCAADLIRAVHQTPGGEVQAFKLDTVDAVLNVYLALVHGSEAPISWFNDFAERLHDERVGPEVSGWIYSWSGALPGPKSMSRPLCILLSSIAATRRPTVQTSTRMVQHWWQDVEKLNSVDRHCSAMRREVLLESFSAADSTIKQLTFCFGRTQRSHRSGRLAASNALKSLGRITQRERRNTLKALSVDEDKVRNFGLAVAAGCFDQTNYPSIVGIQFAGSLVDGISHSLLYTDERKHYLEFIGDENHRGRVSGIGDAVREAVLATAFEALVVGKGLQPTNSPELRDNLEANEVERQNYIADVAARCEFLSARGERPVVLVGNSEVGDMLSSERWGDRGWQCQPPRGISVVPAEGDIKSRINGVPVYQFDTPNGDCYVLPAAYIATLHVEGSNATSALKTTWVPSGDEQIQLKFSWKADFRDASDQRTNLGLSTKAGEHIACT